MSNAVLSYLGWTFLPNFITGNLQTFYYSLTIRAGDAKPAPGSPTFARDRRRIHVAVIAVYLLYTLYEADWEVRRAGDFYADLGIAHDVDDKALQTRFRRLTLLHHPDKVAAATPAHRAAAEQHYVHLKLARDTLLDPAKRFAYDRFGPDVVAWRHCSTVRDFVLTGMRALVPFYAGSAVFMLVFGWLGVFGWGRYWRYLAFATLAVFELHVITRPYFPTVTLLPTVLNPLAALPLPLLLQTRPPYLPFQALRVAHRAIVTLFIAINQLGPLLRIPGPISPLDTGEEAMLAQVHRLEQLVAVNSVEAARLLGLEGAPFVQSEGGRVRFEGTVLLEKVKAWFVTNAVRNDREVQGAVAAVVRRRPAARVVGEGGVMEVL